MRDRTSFLLSLHFEPGERGVPNDGGSDLMFITLFTAY